MAKVYWQLTRQLKGQFPHATDTDYVKEYVNLNRQYRQTAALLQRENALGNPTPALERQLEQLGAEREAVRPFAEAVVEQQVAAVMRDEGLLVAKRFLLPQPKFLFADSYYILVTSPRHKIELEYTRLLGRDLSLADRAEKENRAEKKDPALAALVLPIGGLAAFYPAQIYLRGDLIRLLDLSAHEWLHQYLFVASPLGRKYLQGGRMRIINETIANMLGREIGERVYLRYYGSPEEAAAMEAAYREYLQELAERPESEPPLEEAEGFDFSAFMRETYLEASLLLDQGETAAAETYMEDRRQILLLEGYNIRRLNQAYFAFYGNYADTPVAIDDIGPALAKLRLKTPTPADFLSIVRSIASYEDFLNVMEEQGIR